MRYGIYIGGPKPKAVREFRSAINDILGSGADQATLQKALDVLGQGVQAPHNTSISGVEIVGAQHVNRNEEDGTNE